MGYLIFVLIVSVYIRRFLPAEGFFIDERIKELTWFGYSNEKVLYAPDEEQILNRVRVEKEPHREESEPVLGQVSEGVDLTDIKAKEQEEINTDYIYGNFDDSDESLEEVVSKGLGNNK